MVKVRFGLWETNSSSMHAICLHKQKDLVLSDYIYFGLDNITEEYEDWNTIQKRANYLHTIMYECLSKTDYTETKTNITKILKNNGVKAEWAKAKWRENGYSFDFYDIKDSCSEVILNTIIKDETLLLQYLFGLNSQIIMGYEDMFDKRLKDAEKQYPKGEEYDYLFETW